MDIRIQLDQEIATYRALLQEEKNQLKTGGGACYCFCSTIANICLCVVKLN